MASDDEFHIGWGRRGFLGGSAAALGAALAGSRPARAALPQVEVWKDRSCECCGKWARHMQAAGFPVAIHDADDLAGVKELHAIPVSLQSCHTARVGGYLIEGHVPATDVQRLLTERPQARGLAVPGMPPASPGMDLPGPGYRVFLFGSPAGDSVFAQH
jgi:hypothetical protein